MAGFIHDTVNSDISAETGSVTINGSQPQQTSAVLDDIAGLTLNKGDILVYDGSNIIDLAVGTDGQTLVANSVTASGLEWSTPAGGGTVTSVTAGAGLGQAGTANDPILNVAAADSTITVNANDIAVNVGAVDHDGLLNFVSNEHINHASVSVTAGNGLTGGGDLTATRNFAVGAGTGITVNANDVAVNEGAVDHDGLLNFVANEHINHTSVTLTAGTGMTGGGNIASSRTFNVVGGDGITANANDIEVDSTVVRTTGNQTIAGIKDFTSVVRGPGGTAGAPSFAFTGDSNTGIYNDAANSIAFSTAGTLRVTMTSAGIRSEEGSAASPSFSFVNDTNTGMFRRGTDDIGWSTGGTETLFLLNSGDLEADGDVIAFSDLRSKENLEVITNALDRVKQVNGYTFEKKRTPGRRYTGVVAQEIKEVLPEAVHNNREDDMLSVAYGNMAGLFIEAIKELSAKVEALEAELAELKK